MSGERHPDHLVLVDDAGDRLLTYRKLLEEADALGMAPGALVATRSLTPIA